MKDEGTGSGEAEKLRLQHSRPITQNVRLAGAQFFPLRSDQAAAETMKADTTVAKRPGQKGSYA